MLVFGGPSGTVTQVSIDEGYNAGDWRFGLQTYFTLPAGADGYYVKLVGDRISTGSSLNFVFVKELSEEVYTPSTLCAFSLLGATSTRTFTDSSCGAAITVQSPSVQPGIAAGQATCSYTPAIAISSTLGMEVAAVCFGTSALQVGLKAPTTTSLTIRSVKVSRIEVCYCCWTAGWLAGWLAGW